MLKPDKYKDVIVATLKYLVDNKRVKLFGFVIMPNHLHPIWYQYPGQTTNSTQGSLLRFAAQKMKYDLTANHPKVLDRFLVGAKDRTYQFWERNPLSIEIYTDSTMQQKLDYLHHNPVQEKWQLAESPEDYYYSSASFYKTGMDQFGILTNCFAE